MTPGEIQKRLGEIRETNLGSLSGEEIATLLEERASLEQSVDEVTLQERAWQEAKEKEISLKKEIATLSQSISGTVGDDELFAIITKRRALEEELKKNQSEQGASLRREESASEITEETEEEIFSEGETENPVKPVSLSPPLPVSMPDDVFLDQQEGEPLGAPLVGELSIAPSPLEGEHEGEEVRQDNSLVDVNLVHYKNELRANINTLGTFLQHLPVEAKRSAAFMLEVAKLDPAYAMHYADKDTLKKDPYFNVRIAQMSNARNTGNPLSEMLPEMRTGEVVLEGVKHDFRNVRFVEPQMPLYDEILTMAKKQALKEVETLKHVGSIITLLPPVLQNDKIFMAEVAKVTAA